MKSKSAMTTRRWLLLAILLAAAAAGLVAQQSHAASNRGSLRRRLGLTIVKGQQLPRACGVDIDRLRLMAVGTDGTLQPIPFQIDQRDAHDEFVLPQRSTIGDRGHILEPPPTTDEDGNRFDANDELVFRPADAGDRLPSAASPPATEALLELRLSDRAGAQGWVYLAAYKENPSPLAERRYVEYNPETDEVTTDNYLARHRPGSGDLVFSDLLLRAGDGVDLLDRVKIRMAVTLKVGPTFKYDEDDYHGAVAGYLAGPVRVIRASEHDIFFAPRAEGHLTAATMFGPDYLSLPVRFPVLINVNTIARKASLGVGPDLAPNPGLRFYPSRRTPVVVDGKMTAAERKLKSITPRWFGWAGHGATVLLFGGIVAPYRLPTRIDYLDDAQADVTPDNDPGAWGQALFDLDILTAKKGTVDLLFHMFILPGAYQAGLEQKAMDVANRPLQVVVRQIPSS